VNKEMVTSLLETEWNGEVGTCAVTLIATLIMPDQKNNNPVARLKSLKLETGWIWCASFSEGKQARCE